jgi:hypothetical protein
MQARARRWGACRRVTCLRLELGMNDGAAWNHDIRRLAATGL